MTFLSDWSCAARIGPSRSPLCHSSFAAARRADSVSVVLFNTSTALSKSSGGKVMANTLPFVVALTTDFERTIIHRTSNGRLVAV